MLAALIPRKAYLVTAMAVGIVAVGVYLRIDAVRDERARQRVAEAAARIEALHDARERRHAIEDLDDDGLRTALCRRLQHDNRGAVPGCGATATSEQPGND